MYTPQDIETSLESGLKAGQLEIPLSKKDNIYAWKSHYRQNIFLSTKWETEERQVERKSNQIRSLFVEPVTNAPLSNQLKFPKYYM